jgi:hypothetical protein
MVIEESKDEHWARQLSDTLTSEVGRIRPVSAVARISEVQKRIAPCKYVLEPLSTWETLTIKRILPQERR